MITRQVKRLGDFQRLRKMTDSELLRYVDLRIREAESLEELSDEMHRALSSSKLKKPAKGVEEVE